MQSKESLACSSQGFTVQPYDLVIQQCALWKFTVHCSSLIHWSFLLYFPLPCFLLNYFHLAFIHLQIAPKMGLPLNSKFFSTMPIMVKPISGNITQTITDYNFDILIIIKKKSMPCHSCGLHERQFLDTSEMAPKGVICMCLWYECLFLQENSWPSQERFSSIFFLRIKISFNLK